jgi:hypothetical protein
VSKSSFILTLLRLVVEPWHKAALWFMLVTINLSMGSISIVQFFLCSVPPTPGCVSSDVVIGLGVFAAGYSAAMDLVLTGFPSLVIWKLQMKRREKVGIIASMSLGVVYVLSPALPSFPPSLTLSSAGVVGIYKSSTIPAVSRSADFTHGTAIVLIWLVAEFVATVIACSIPFFRPLLRLVSGATRSKGSSTYAMNSGMGKGGHSKLGSRTDVVKPNPDDTGSDKDELPLNSGHSGVVHRTDVFPVEYDNWSGNEGSNNGHSAPGQARREMC